MARTIFDKLHLSSAIDGDWRIHSLQGLSRLSPSLYFGSTQLPQVTVAGYYNCPDLAEFRVAVREIRSKPPPSELSGEDVDPQVEKELREGTPEWNKRLACPNLFDLDTRNLYFGQLNQQPQYAKFKVGQESDPAWNDPKVLSGEIDDETGKPYEPGPEGRSVKGMPVRLQQVHFQAYNVSGPCDDLDGDAAKSGDEFAAYFLVSNPVGPIPPPVTTPALTIDSDFSLQRHGEVKYWTYNRWTYDGSEKTAKKDWSKRLIIGQADAGTQLFDSLTEALNKGGGPASGGASKCLPKFVTHVYATDCGLKYNYVKLNKSKGKVTWTAGVEDIIDFTDCESGSCVPGSDGSEPSCSLSSSSVSCSSASYSSLPSGESAVGGGQIGCPRDYCPGMEPEA